MTGDYAQAVRERQVWAAIEDRQIVAFAVLIAKLPRLRPLEQLELIHPVANHASCRVVAEGSWIYQARQMRADIIAERCKEMRATEVLISADPDVG
jgi:hypothetical protein